VPAEFAEFIERATHVKLLSDAPLELSTWNGLPLFLQKCVSRMPTTPGNLFLDRLITVKQQRLVLTELEEVLVVRSFATNDPVRDCLEQAVKEVLRRRTDGRRFAVRFVDVQTKDEFCNALNAFKGDILIFDGHGRHDPSSDTGLLVLQGGEAFNPWELARRVRVPWIVVLAACETHFLGKSHSTAAAGFISLGAMSVIATHFPIDGIASARFVARLLLRIRDFLPWIVELRPAIRWSEVVSGFMRMSYLTDLLSRIDDSLDLDEWLLDQVHMRGNSIANILGHDWRRFTDDILAAALGATPEAIHRARSESPFLPTMRFVHLGVPEKLVVYGPTHEKEAEEGARILGLPWSSAERKSDVGEN
jgi:hypothetical protein